MNDLTRRGMLTGSLAAASVLTIGSTSPGSAASDGRQDLTFVDPELRQAARQLLAVTALEPPLSQSTLAISRKAMTSYASLPQATPRFEKRVLPGAVGAPEVTVYIINASAGSSRPAILHTHGGGYIGGSALSSIADLQATASVLDCTIVTVEYRLAPETTYRGSVEDNYTGLLWLYRNANALGVDPHRIAVMGESAGGGHAALLALAARDRGEVPLIFQVLIYPMLDDRTGTKKTPAPPIGNLLWTPEKNRFGWQSFLGQAPGTNLVPPAAVPARHPNLAGLPPAFIGVGSIDLFVDEDVAFANRLIDVHVATQLVVVPGAFHGFDGIAASTKIAHDFTAAKLDALRRAFYQASSVRS